MKTKTLINISVLLPLILFTTCVYMPGDSITGNRNIVSEIREATDFKQLSVSGALEVILTLGSEPGIEVLADENLHEYIKTEFSRNGLVIKTTANIQRAASKKVYVSVPSLESIQVSSASSLEAQNTLTAKAIRINTSSAAELDLDIQATNLQINVSSSGRARLRGEVEQLKADVSSAGQLSASELECTYAEVRVSSAGSAEVFVMKNLQARASSSGSIRYREEPENLNINTSSAGSVKKW